MLMKKGIPFYELLAFYLNIGMIVELLDKALLLVGLNFNYVSIVQQGLYLLIGCILFFYIIKDSSNTVNNLLKFCLFITILIISILITPGIEKIIIKSVIYFLTQVYLVYCCIENSREIDWLVNSLKKYIFLAMVYAGIVYIVFGKNEFAYSMDFSYKSFLPAALSFLLFSRKKKKLYLGIFVFFLVINFRVGSRGIFACYAFLIIFNYIVNINRKNLLLYVIIGAAGFLGIFFLLFNMQTIGEIIIKKAPLSRTAVLMANNRLLDLSGRREYYITCINKIIEEPLHIRGILSDRIFMGDYFGRETSSEIFGSYAHNIFVELGFQFGIIGIFLCLILIIFFIRAFIKTYKMKHTYPELCMFFLMVSSFSIGQLLFSDSYLTTLSFGLLCGIIKLVDCYWKKYKFKIAME